MNAPSGIVTDNALNADVGETTSITGGVIASRSGDLTLETERLETADIDLHRKGRQVSGSVGVSIGSNPEGKSKPGITVEGAYSNSETEGVARATIGEGEITVRDGDGDGIKAADLEAEADAAEAEGDTARAEALRTEADREAAEDTTATETQLSNLNRDPDAVVEVTSQKQEGFELYVSDTAVRDLGKVLSAVGQAIEKLDVSPQQRELLKRLAACGGRQGYNRYNPLNWIVTPAYAADCSQTAIEDLMFGIKRETLAELVEYCESLDPGVQAYAKAALAARIFADLPAADRAQLKSITKWDIESVSGLSYDTVLMLELANEALHCQAPSCKNTKNQTVLKLYNTIGQKELHLATFLKLTPPSESSLGFDTTGMSWSQYITVLQAEELIAQAGGHVVGEAVAKAGALITRRLGAKIAEAFSANVKAANRTPDGPNPGTRPGATDAEAGIGTSTVKFDGSPTAHEARLGQELAEQGLDVRIRGENVPGPDAQINGLWYDIKELSGTGRRSLQSSINSAKNNFSNNGAAGLGLGRSDTRALIDARGNGTWDNAASIRTELDRLSRNGDLSNVAEVRVITSNGPIVWKPQ